MLARATGELAEALSNRDQWVTLHCAPDALRGLTAATEVATYRIVAEAPGRLRPDVVVMDLHLPGMSGVEATLRILAEFPSTGILVLTMLEGDDSLFAAR